MSRVTSRVIHSVIAQLLLTVLAPGYSEHRLYKWAGSEHCHAPPRYPQNWGRYQLTLSGGNCGHQPTQYSGVQQTREPCSRISPQPTAIITAISIIGNDWRKEDGRFRHVYKLCHDGIAVRQGRLKAFSLNVSATRPDSHDIF
ncbi:hypothetical protein P280DRAFT_197853 [Massarina eburnea CBS 473.64]|uniref:Uncharacterized protein n=1 Tax=Massarina eburnea CBS 473.64 TaxID=1395130 RepID=A0A6A6RL80_9PLEO|nr:hypothetical protein P280DRAFT_197853 [Massarina eburnea CBS 473.64]